MSKVQVNNNLEQFGTRSFEQFGTRSFYRRVSMKLVAPNEKKGDKFITITNGNNSLEGKGYNYSINLFEMISHPYEPPSNPLTYPINHPSALLILKGVQLSLYDTWGNRAGPPMGHTWAVG